MSTVRVLVSLTEYEVRKSLARKRVLILLAVTFLLEVGLYLVLTRLPPAFINPFSSSIWVVGIIAPSAGLVHVLALTIGSATSAEEYESGTADYWFTRPIRRLTYFAGKTIGGIALLLIFISTYSLLSVAISWYAFGPQTKVELLPLAIAVSVAAAMPFYSIGLLFGESLRRSMMSTVLSGTVFFASALIEGYANIATVIGNDPSLLEAVKYLPTWAAAGITSTILLDSMGLNFSVPGPGFFLSRVGAENLVLAAANLISYSAVPLALAWIRFRYSDVTKRAQ
ncbi:MAG: ABC transporter permease [Candidatus Caldarchaeum sp.]|nr:ABC transporter permease [Candidatus Caldarchaeum sp.]